MLKALTPCEKLGQQWAEAADAMEVHGFCQRQCVDDEGSMCVRGTIAFVLDNNPKSFSLASHEAVMRLHPWTEGMHPVDWNNHNARTKEQVVAMLRRAAREVALMAELPPLEPSNRRWVW